MIASVHDLVDHLLARTARTSHYGELGSPAAGTAWLHGLLYWTQGWHTGLHGTPAFDAPVVAGPAGPYVPVVREVHGPGVFVRYPWPGGRAERLPDHVRHLADVIYDAYGARTGHSVIERSRAEPPVAAARARGVQGGSPVVDLGDLQAYYAECAEEGQQRLERYQDARRLT